MVIIQKSPADGCFVLKTSLVLEHSREALFEFFSDAFQLEQLTPQWLHFKILTPAPIQIQEGCLIDYSIRLHGIPIPWRTEITRWNPPHSFMDRQISGPYLLWEHLHTFETVPDGTLAVDEVRYRVFGGGLTNRLFVESKLKRIFEYRQEKMRQLFPARDLQTALEENAA